MTVSTVPTVPPAPPRKRVDDGWETPVPLDAGTVPPFPVGALPDVFQDYVSALAGFAEVPSDLPGVLVLGVTAAAIARKVRIQVRDGYLEPLNTFAAIAMPSGSRKTAVFGDVTAPLVAYERELLDRMGPEIAEAQSRARVREKELAHAERMAAGGGTDASKWDNTRRKLARFVRETEIPPEPRVLMADATELKNAGVTLVDEHNFWLMCDVCRQTWSPNQPSGGRRLHHGYWRCPNSCNAAARR